MDAKPRDTSMRLVLASVPVQALIMVGAAGLLIGGSSASPAPGGQVWVKPVPAVAPDGPFTCAQMLDPGSLKAEAPVCRCPAASAIYWPGSAAAPAPLPGDSSPSDGFSAQVPAMPADGAIVCVITVDPATGQPAAGRIFAKRAGGGCC
jgi:hypothetical protein